MKAKVSLGASKIKLPCLRKGVVVGAAACAVNDLNVQISVLTEPDPPITRGAVKDLRESLKALRRSLKNAAPEIAAMDAAAAALERKLRGKPATWVHSFLKEDLRAIQSNFRAAVKVGFSECGAPNIRPHDMAELLDDNAFFLEAAKAEQEQKA